MIRENPNKICQTCGESKSLDDFHKANTKKCGYSFRCKECTKKYWEEYKSRPKIVSMFKICSHCGIQKAIEEFYKHSRSPDGYHPWCKECDNNKRKIYAKSEQGKAKIKEIRHNGGRFALSVGRAKQRSLEWILTREEYYELVSKPCEYCEDVISTGGTGLDRIDNTKGYIISNVVPCCKICNKTKQDYFTYEDMKNVIGPNIKMIKIARGDFKGVYNITNS